MELQITWFVLWSVLWIVYFALDGFDLGCGIVLNFISKNDNEKQAVINTVGPFWDGNEVWLITAGGATFAAFPIAYADMFSWLYLPLFLILMGLILRGVSFELRGKTSHKKMWDIFIFTGSLLPALLFGVAFGNFWAGIPIDLNGYSKGTIGLLNVSGLVTGLLFVSVFVMHGLIWISYKIEGEMGHRACEYSKKIWFVSLVMAVLFILLLPFWKNPNFKMGHFNSYLMVFFYILSAVSFVLIRKKLDKNNIFTAFIFSLFFIALFLAGSFSGMYPNIMASNLSPEFNVSIFNSSSSRYTLKIMTVVAFLFVPIVIAYQIWAYKVLNHKVNPEKPETLHY